ncbi:PREDICTED: UPF0764 protein C16orf89-like [Elephantulus edwardii]|uniref:UPF0764 protein C16orf89-like n=1 Tax=Elephantulus edwardii TaxID=28737 RepID=UPI0003F06FC9|nr:PREDICTED: UPF0764 protein C16orf89-like [Elephantulus edwardii]
MSVLGMLLSLLLLTLSRQHPTSPQFLLKDIETHDENDTTPMADVILSSLNAATTCLEKKNNLFVDDVISLRILQAYVKGITELWARNPEMESIDKKMKTFSRKLEYILGRSIFQLSKALSGKLGVFEVLIREDFWKVPQPLLLTKDTVIPTRLYTVEIVRANTSEICTITLLNNSGHPKSCTYTEFCRQLMTMPVHSHSQRIQQLMYFLFSKMIGCRNGMYKKSQQYMNRVCSKLMNENAEIESTNYHSSSRDEFLESIMLCGTAGFVNFYNSRWLVNILRWQKATDGCFSTACHILEDPKYSSKFYSDPHGPSRVRINLRT